MRIVLTGLLLVIACSDDPGPHDTISCGTDWAAIGYTNAANCDRACEPMPAGWPGTGPTCPTVDTTAPNPTCVFFDYMGVRGCCEPTGVAHSEIRFFECQ